MLRQVIVFALVAAASAFSATPALTGLRTQSSVRRASMLHCVLKRNWQLGGAMPYPLCDLRLCSWDQMSQFRCFSGLCSGGCISYGMASAVMRVRWLDAFGWHRVRFGRCFLGCRQKCVSGTVAAAASQHVQWWCKLELGLVRSIQCRRLSPGRARMDGTVA
eukprot:2224365-Rhodomonas_salina.1